MKKKLIYLVYYLDLDGRTKQRSEEIYNILNEQLKLTFKNVTDYDIKYTILGSNKTKVKCIYPNKIKRSTIKKLLEKSIINYEKSIINEKI